MSPNDGGREWVVVTGATGGIGRALVKTLASNGYGIVFCYRRRAAAEELIEHVAELPQCAGTVAGLECDLLDPVAIDRFIEECLERFGVPYGLVCNAAVAANRLSFDLDQESIHRAFQVNLFSAMQLSGKFSRQMARLKRGRIVLMSSIASAVGNRGNGIYSATKGGLESFMRAILDEFSRRGVTVNCVLPGFIDAGLGVQDPSSAKEVRSRIPARRQGSALEVCSAVNFLLSEHAGYINGAMLTVDGGVAATLGARQ